MTDKLIVVSFTGKTVELTGKEREEFEKFYGDMTDSFLLKLPKLKLAGNSEQPFVNATFSDKRLSMSGNPSLVGETYSLRLDRCVNMKPGERAQFGVIAKQSVCLGDEPTDDRSYVKTTIKPDVDVALVPIKRADFVNHAELLHWFEDGKKCEIKLTPYTFIRFLEAAIDECKSDFPYAMVDKLSEVEYVKSLLSFGGDDGIVPGDANQGAYPFLGIVRASDRQQKDNVRSGVIFPSASDFIKDGDCRLHLELALSVKYLSEHYGIAGNRATSVIIGLSIAYFSGLLNRELHEAFMLHDCIKHMHDHSLMKGSTESFDDFCASLVYTVRSRIYDHLCLPDAARLVCDMMCKINGTAHPAGSSSWRVAVDLGEE